MAQADIFGHWSEGSITSVNLTGVAYGNGVFVAVGNNEVWTSKDAFSWSKSPSFVVNISLSAITFAEGVFVAVGTVTTPGYTPNIIITSVNGKDWQTTSSTGDGPWKYVTFVNNQFVAFGGPSQGYSYKGAQSGYSASPDGYSWSDGNFEGVFYVGIVGVTYANGSFFTATSGSGFPATIYASPTLSQMGFSPAHTNSRPRATSTPAVMPAFLGEAGSFAGTLSGFANGRGTLVAVGAAGLITTSVDEVGNWTTAASGTANTLEAVTYANGYFVSVGADGAVVTSSDGITWTYRNSKTKNLLQGVAYGKSHFVAVGLAGTVVISSDESAPVITKQPTALTVKKGATAVFTVTASGNPAPTYAWQRNNKILANGGNIKGITTAKLTLTKVTSANAGSYRVVVSNAIGTATSSAVKLTVK